MDVGLLHPMGHAGHVMCIVVLQGPLAGLALGLARGQVGHATCTGIMCPSCLEAPSLPP